MNGMLARLEESQAAQRRFVSDASHELKSPLASLRQYAEVARAHPDRISAAELSDAVLDEGARLERLVQGDARADPRRRGRARARARPSGPRRPAARRSGAPARAGADRGRRRAPSTRPACAATSALLRQVVRNLADNAAAARARPGGVRVAAPTLHGAVLTVEDDGAGIAPAERDRVFERFVRLDEARARDAGGSGLGLAIVREIVRAHGGDVRVDAARSAARGSRLAARLTDSAGFRLASGPRERWSPTQEDTMRKPTIWITIRRQPPCSSPAERRSPSRRLVEPFAVRDLSDDDSSRPRGTPSASASRRSSMRPSPRRSTRSARAP